MGWDGSGYMTKRSLTSFEDIQADDFVYLLEGASIPMLVRIQKYHLAVLRLADAMLYETDALPADFDDWVDDTLLVWDWASTANKAQPKYFLDCQIPNCMKAEMEGDLHKALRLLRALLSKYTSLEDKHRYIVDSPKYSAETVIEVLEIYDRVLAALNNGYITDDDSVVKLLARASSSYNGWKTCRTPLWLAASTGRYDVAQRILGSGEVDGIFELRLAVELKDEAVVGLLLDTNHVDPLIEDDEGKTPADYAMAAKCLHPLAGVTSKGGYDFDFDYPRIGQIGAHRLAEREFALEYGYTTDNWNPPRAVTEDDWGDVRSVYDI
ncbi:hypothetical protein QBC44DRAFT_373776 [Cladorrhinum sp. PSN332]|nr:hypothetical protein QBC44DRAFT_373776 [Cladorrhinum sp. PSN332]